MTKKTIEAQTYQSDIAAAMHEMMSGFYEAGVIPKNTMRELDELCLTPVEKLKPEQIKAIRENEFAS